MTRAAFGIALVICGSLTLAAQDSGKPEMKTIYLTAPFPAATCPIDMFASQNIWNHTIAVQKGLNEKFGQRITLTLRDSHRDRIVAGTVRVEGLTGKNHLVQTGPAQNGDFARTLKVSFAERSDGSVSGDLWIGGFTSITSIQLLEASYADGSTWRISGHDVCNVKPDPIMLISNR
jgi:hypothetical protein